MVDKAVINAVLAAVAAPFAALTCLRCFTTSEAVPLLASSLPLIKHLSLYITDSEARCHLMMPALAMLHCLTTLRLRFSGFSMLRYDELLELQSLNALSSLKLIAYNGELVSYQLDHSHITSLVTAIGRHMRELELLLTAPCFTVDAIRIIGQNCPSLERLALYGEYALHELDLSGPPLFPVIASLELGRATKDGLDDDEDERYLTACMLLYCPLLLLCLACHEFLFFKLHPPADTLILHVSTIVLDLSAR